MYLSFSSSIISDVPSAPGIPEVEEVGGDFVSLTWAKPSSDGGGKITGFWIDKREHGRDDWTRVNSDPCITNIYNIANLIEDRRYEFRVFAENGAGLSPASVASNSIKVKDPNGKGDEWKISIWVQSLLIKFKTEFKFMLFSLVLTI